MMSEPWLRGEDNLWIHIIKTPVGIDEEVKED
jgi:hypothetical protein